MAKESKLNLGQPNWRVPTILTAFAEGDKFAPALYEAFRRDIKERFGDNQYLNVLTLVQAGKDNPAYMTGSNTFSASRLDNMVRPFNMRVVTLADLSNPQVLSMVKDNHYSDTPAFVVQSNKDNREQNRGILKQVTELAESKAGSIKYPFMVQGFDVVPSEEDRAGYGLKVVARPDFAVAQDERLSGKNNEKQFTDVDELGLPKFDKNGKRQFFARDNGISGLYLVSDLNLSANDDNLANSNEDGRVVLVSGEATGADFIRQYQAQLREQVEARKSELDKWFTQSMVNMPTGRGK
ncbi:MAG: hypothetical protein AABW80_05365 [Nanoarchaeota archaeon]